MRKLLYIFVAFTSFAVGILGYYFSPKFLPTSLFEATERMQNAERFKPQKVHLVGYLEIHKFKLKDSDETKIIYGLFDYRTFCWKDCMAGADLDLSENLKNNAEISNLIDELAKKNNDFEKGMYLAKVEITGKIEKIPSCFTSGYLVTPESIKQTSPVVYLSEAKINELIQRK